MKKEHKTTNRKKSDNFFSTAFNEFNHSFKNIIKFPSFLIVLLYTLLFFGASWILFYIWGKLTEQFMTIITNGAPANLMDATQAQLDLLSANLPKIYVYFITTGIVLALLLVLVWTIFEGLAWLNIMQKKKSFAYFWKFTLLNLIWFLVFGILTISGMLLWSTNYTYLVIFGAALFVLWIYFTFILYTVFTQDSKSRVFASFGKMFKTVFSKGHIILFHFLLVTIVFVLINIMMYFTIQLPAIPEIIYTLLSALVILVFAAWMQFYLINIVKKEIE